MDAPHTVTARDEQSEYKMDNTYTAAGEQNKQIEMDVDQQGATLSTSSLKRPGSPLNIQLAKSPKTSRKSRRRSSFVVGRISKTLPTVSTDYIYLSELHKHVPSDLPNDERLATLFESANQLAVGTLERECDDFEGIQQFTVYTKNAVEECVTKWRAEGKLKDADQKNLYVPNPLNIEMDEAIKDGTAHTDRLKEECNKWEELVETRKKLAQEAAQKCENNTAVLIAERPESLPGHWKRYLEGSPDYSNILQDLRVVKEKTVLSKDEINRYLTEIENWQTSKETLTQKHTENLHSNTFKDLPDFGKAKKLFDEEIVDMQCKGSTDTDESTQITAL